MAKQQPVIDIPGVNLPDLRRSGIRVHRLPRVVSATVAQARRDFYKVGLVTGEMSLHYGGQPVEINGSALFFVNPRIPHTVVRRSRTSGYACLFTESFLTGRERNALLKTSPLYNATLPPALPLDAAQTTFMTGVFRKMLEVYHTSHPYKNEVLRSCLALVLEQAHSLQPAVGAPLHQNAATRITHLFLDLLERQFPIESPAGPLQLRTPQDFAASLSVHVNYLNRTVKEVTGRPTSAHIADRILAEATALLRYTDWSVADIAYALGFEYPTYFNNYFKKMTGITPLSLRKQV